MRARQLGTAVTVIGFWSQGCADITWAALIPQVDLGLRSEALRNQGPPQGEAAGTRRWGLTAFARLAWSERPGARFPGLEAPLDDGCGADACDTWDPDGDGLDEIDLWSEPSP